MGPRCSAIEFTCFLMHNTNSKICFYLGTNAASLKVKVKLSNMTFKGKLHNQRRRPRNTAVIYNKVLSEDKCPRVKHAAKSNHNS